MNVFFAVSVTAILYGLIAALVAWLIRGAAEQDPLLRIKLRREGRYPVRMDQRAQVALLLGTIGFVVAWVMK